MSEPSISDLNLVTLKHGNCYAIFDRNGDIAQDLGVMGVYIDDMRYTSTLTLMLGDQKPNSSGAQVTGDNVEFVVRLSNPEMKDGAGTVIRENTVHLLRRIAICDRLVHQAITVRNYNPHPVALPLNVKFDSDFVDMFNVRGRTPKTLGAKEAAEFTHDFARVSWNYKGVDQAERKANIFFSSVPKPKAVTESEAQFVLELPGGGEQTLYLEFGKFKDDAVGPGPKSYNDAINVVRQERAEMLSQGLRLEFSNPQFQQWFSRSLSDLAFLNNHYDGGPYPCAGVPWFAVPFGRDGIITALEMLWAKPELAKGVLNFLSERQAKTKNALQDAEPGKIMHETRENEMSRAGMVPFGLYYGGVDTTLLYIVLAGEYLQRTNDVDFLKKIWPNIQAALRWMEDYAEDKNWPDGEADGFMVYQRKLDSGLYNQMWKDSSDSVFYADGDTDVKFPRAVCEVQGYAYAAWTTAARLARLFEDAEASARYQEKAQKLYERFNRKFWDEKEGYYFLALDGGKKPCRVKASNMGQLLFTGIVPPERAGKIVSWLMDEGFFSGFGIRTVRDGEARYNPLSYHNGSVWPHDTAVIAGGMGRAGHPQAALRVFQGLFETASQNDWRLPELFSGFGKEADLGFTPYPHACSPQAWAAGAPFFLLQAVLGLEIDAATGNIRVNPDNWPAAWGTLKVRNLPVNGGAAGFEVSAGSFRILESRNVNFVLSGNQAESRKVQGSR